MTGVAAWMRAQWAQPMARYAVMLCVYLSAVGFAYEELESYAWPFYDSLAAVTADLTAAVLGIVSSDATSVGQLIFLDGFALDVIAECLGTLETVIFVAFILAYPTSWRAKVWGLLLGPVAIYLLNCVRLVTLVAVGAYLPEQFELVHVYFWQATLIAVIAVTWLGWLRVFALR